MKHNISLNWAFWLPILLPLTLFAPLLIQGKALFWGVVSLQFIPWRVLAAELLKSGQLPLWNPLVGMGAPLLANYQSGLLYPPNWSVLIGAFTGGAALAAQVQTWLAVLHLSWGGLGMARFTRRLGYSELAQALCGMAFAGAGYCVSRAGFFSINATVAWFPWVMLAVTNLVWEKPRFGSFARAALAFTMLLLGGHAQTSWYTVLFAAIWAGFLAWWKIERPNSTQENRLRFLWLGLRMKEVFYHWFWLALTALCAVLLAAAQLLPTLELLLQSQRANSVEYELAMTYSFWPWRLLTLFSPHFFGSPVTGDYWGYANYWEDALYFGVLPVLLAVGAMVALVPRRRERNPIVSSPGLFLGIPLQKAIGFYLAMTFVSILLALGKNTPVYPWLYHHIPTFAIFQAPTRISIWAEFSLILLAGIGLARLRRPSGRALYWARLGTAGAGAVALGAGLAWMVLGDVSPTFIRGAAWFSLFALLAGILILTTPDHAQARQSAEKRSRLWKVCLLTVVGVDLVWAGWGLNPGIEVEYYREASPSATLVRQMAGSQRVYLDPQSEYQLKFDRFFRFDSFSIPEEWRAVRSVLLPVIHTLDGIASANNFDPLIPSRYAHWMAEVDDLYRDGNSAAFTKAMSLMGVGVVEALDPSSALGVSFRPLGNHQRFRLVACAIYAHGSDEAWMLLTDPAFDPDQHVVLEGVEEAASEDCPPESRVGEIRVAAEGANQIIMEVNATRHGWLVLSDVWYPGWKAEVDGEDAPVYRANFLFRAIRLEPGEHRISWKYQPLSFWIGLTTSLIGWLSLLALWIWKIVRSRSELSSAK